MVEQQLRTPEDLMQNGKRELRDRMKLESLSVSLQRLCAVCHDANLKWWQDPSTKQPIQRNVGELLMLCVSELAEGMEAHRKNLNDYKLADRPGLEVELVDCLIRIFDLAGALNLDIGGAFIDKMEFNRTRTDHTHEARLQTGGKKY